MTTSGEICYTTEKGTKAKAFYMVNRYKECMLELDKHSIILSFITILTGNQSVLSAQ